MNRIRFVYASLLVTYVLILFRLFYWQVIQSPRLKAQAAKQHFLEFRIPPERGMILSQDGSPFVINQPAFLAYAEPKHIEQPAIFAREVSAILELDEQKILQSITEPNRVWVLLKRKVEQTTVEKLDALGIKGIGYEKEPKRFYPEASSAAHLLGFVGSDQNGNDMGYFGLEGQYNRELQGKEGYMRIEKDVHGAPILIGDVERVEPENGRNLITWVDRSIQYIVERRLLEGLEKYGAKEGSVIMMDPNTGGILAMAAYPNYNPQIYSQFDKDLYRNPVVAGSFEPGSTFKTVMMAAGLNEHVITPTTTYEETGPVRVGEYAIRTWDNKYRGTSTLTEALQHSSNVGMVFIANKLGKQSILKYINAFGFGQKTGVDLEDESTPDIRDPKDWKEIDYATISFGQGIAVTPLQMVRAVAAIANGGKLMKPQIVRALQSTDGTISEKKPEAVRQILDPVQARVMTEMMVAAVEYGEAKWAKPKGFRIAGKTGTAQIPVAGHYDEEKTIASFVGFAPAENPRFVMLVTLREPSSSPWGSETAAPLFFRITQDVFQYYGLTPK